MFYAISILVMLLIQSPINFLSGSKYIIRMEVLSQWCLAGYISFSSMDDIEVLIDWSFWRREMRFVHKSIEDGEVSWMRKYVMDEIGAKEKGVISDMPRTWHKGGIEWMGLRRGLWSKPWHKRWSKVPNFLSTASRYSQCTLSSAFPASSKMSREGVW